MMSSPTDHRSRLDTQMDTYHSLYEFSGWLYPSLSCHYARA